MAHGPCLAFESGSDMLAFRQVAAREYKRLKRTSEQAPGYAMSRIYLETLADLPWNRLAAAAPAKSVPSTAEDKGGTTQGRGDAGSTTGSNAAESGSSAGSEEDVAGLDRRRGHEGTKHDKTLAPATAAKVFYSWLV